MNLEPIDTATILSTTDPVPVTDIDVPGWIITETMEITFGDYSGRPDVERVQLAREMLSYFFSQGWYIAAVIDRGSDGSWKSVASRSTQESRSKSSSGSVSENSTGTASSNSTEDSNSNGSSGFSNSYSTYGGTDGTSSGNSNGQSQTQSSGNASASGQSSSEESSTKSEASIERVSGCDTETREEDAAYWSSWQKVRLQRKRIAPHKVLESMVGELVTSYKSGEKAVAERYSAVIALYSTMLSRTEDEISRLGDEVDSFKDLMSGVMDTIRSTMERIVSSGTDDKVNEAAEYQRRVINEKFDALIARQKGDLITAGLFNSTQWTMIVAGIERERGTALIAVSDKILGWRRDIASAAAGLAGPLESAAKAMYEAGADGVKQPTQLRNEVLKWMLDYAERHNTERAKVEDIAQVPKILDGISGGYAQVGSVS